MKWIKLLTAAHIGGQLRHPHEGVVHLGDEEADRLIAGGVGVDVSGDFTARQDRAPAETLEEATAGAEAAPAPAHPHQAEVAPQAVGEADADATDETPTRRRKPAASKE